MDESCRQVEVDTFNPEVEGAETVRQVIADHIESGKDGMRKCLNCGTPSAGRFCPECGQSMATGRFTMHSFGVHLLSSLTRVSGDFLRTAAGLLWHPWKVVRDYVHGRRVGLVSPVSMLLLLSLYWGIVMAFVPHFNTSEQLQTLKLGALLKWLYGSITFQYLFLAIPIAVGTRAVYRRDMRGRYNFAELVVATLYLASTFLLVDFILSPLEMVNELAANIIVVLVTGVYGVMSVLKAFPQSSARKTAGKLAVLTAVCGGLLFLFLMLFTLPMYREVL